MGIGMNEIIKGGNWVYLHIFCVLLFIIYLSQKRVPPFITIGSFDFEKASWCRRYKSRELNR